MFGHLNYALLTSIALYETVSASGATMNACFGFNNGKGYDVNIQYFGLDTPYSNSFCQDLQQELTGDFGWCLQDQNLNCVINDDLLFLGISTVNQDAGLSCIQAAVIYNLAAPVVAGPLGPESLVCFDIDNSTKAEKQSPMNGIIAAEIGQTITVASGQQLTLQSLTTKPDTQNNFLELTSEFFDKLIPNLSSELGNTGLTMTTQHVSDTSGNNLLGSINAGLHNNVVGNVDETDYETILGALGYYINSVKSGQTAIAEFTTDSDEVALIVYLYALVST